ncbi:MAG: hypothetical protein K6T75_11130 [Acetobacteraceae bacterium]|nr:hypothetical protein [Acetobacteraceae bacterium]
MVTVTHYPCFVVPYKTVPAARREAVVRGRVEDGRSWAKLSEEAGYSPATVRRWVAEVNRRAPEIVTGILAILQRLVTQTPASIPAGDGVAGRGAPRAMFRVADALTVLLAGAGTGREEMPRLSLPRVLRPPGPSPLPVWA